VAALLGGFRDHLGYDFPSDDSLLASVERIIARDDAEYLLGGETEPQGVAQVRSRWSVCWEAADCWLEDLYVRPEARGSGLGRAGPLPLARLRDREDRRQGRADAPSALASRLAGSLARAQRQAGPDQLALAQMQVALRRQHLLDVRRADRLERRGGHMREDRPLQRVLESSGHVYEGGVNRPFSGTAQEGSD
jgi:GNAT superfamily N-acetyltransferase